jgi:hypothetical protein
MQSTTNPKEHTMKTTATHKLLRLATVAAPAATLAATAGMFNWSDETLKQEIQPLKGSLARLLAL